VTQAKLANVIVIIGHQKFLPIDNVGRQCHYASHQSRSKVDIQVHYVISPDFCGEYQKYTSLETLYYKQSEKQCFHLLRDLYGRHLGFYRMAAIKQVFVNISASK